MCDKALRCDPLFFVFCRHDDLKEMLDSNKDGLKLEAMKRIIGVSHPHLSFIAYNCTKAGRK